MRFILSEYISLLKEDGELDTLIADLLVGMKITPISIPQKGRQHGVDIAAVGVDPDDGKKKVYLIAVKQKNLTRSNWDTGVNAVRPSLNEIIDTYIPTMLDKRYKKLPVKIVVATSGELELKVQINWATYTKENSKKKRAYEFWGTGELAKKLDEYLVSEKLFPQEYQSFLRKTLAFLDLPDYKYHHFYELIAQILSAKPKQRQQILKRLRLVRLCTNIIFKWSQDINNLKPALICSEHTLLKTWHWINANNHFDKSYVHNEYYNLFALKKVIGVTYFNKVSAHYTKLNSLYRYSKNYIEYSLNSWEQLGLLATIGLTEVQQAQFFFSIGKQEEAYNILKGAKHIAQSVSALITNNPPLNYPKYDEHCIELMLAFHLLYLTGEQNSLKTYIHNLTVAFHNNYIIDKDFPLFRTNFDKLVDVHNGDDNVEIESSTILTLMIEYAVLIDDETLYQEIRQLVEEDFPKLNLQIWLATDDIEDAIGDKSHSSQLGTLKHSIVVYNNMEEYKKEVLDEVELYLPEKNFIFYKTGYEIIGHLASRHFIAQPFPIFWRSIIKHKADKKSKSAAT